MAFRRYTGFPLSEVAIARSSYSMTDRSVGAVKEHDYNTLFASLNQAVEILHGNRTPDPAFIAAYDTLKQSRAMLVKALNSAATTAVAEQHELVAA
jgi:hypothetical protein